MPKFLNRLQGNTEGDVSDDDYEKCPNCGWPMLTIKTTKRRGTEKVCPQKDCGYTEAVEEIEETESEA